MLRSARIARRGCRNGTRVAVEIARPGSNDISVYNLARGTLIPLISDGRLNYYPIWTPDGQAIVFGSVRDTNDGRLSYPCSVWRPMAPETPS